jgi:hypothetical protein
MRLSSASALNKSSAQSKKTVSSGFLKRFKDNVSAKFSPVTDFFKTPEKIESLKNETTALESKTGVIQGKLNTTEAQVTWLEANLKQAESKISELTTEMGKKVTVLTAGVIAAVASLIGAGLSYLGVQAGIKPTDDSKPKKRKVMDL